MRQLRGHTQKVYTIAWSPEGTRLVSGGWEERLRIWDIKSGQEISKLDRKHQRTITSLAWSPDGTRIASGGWDGTICIWDGLSYQLLHQLITMHTHVTGVAWTRSGDKLAATGFSNSPTIWNSRNWSDITPIWKESPLKIQPCYSIVWSKKDKLLLCASADKTVVVYSIKDGLIQHLEGHTGEVKAISCSADGNFIATKGSVNDNSVLIWRADTLSWICGFTETSKNSWRPNLAFHPNRPILATLGDQETSIRIWELDLTSLLGQVTGTSTHYKNAKVVLVGDTGVGKTGLSLVLNNEPYMETDSTAGRHVWTFDSQEVQVGRKIKQVRETLLWDLAGQPGYRIIHQLHLNEVAAALVVFDARSEIDPLAGVRHWERALRLAQQRQGTSITSMKKFLVSARNDRGGVSISEDRLQAILKEFGFNGYFKTSAKEGWQIKELRSAIQLAIAWEDLPEVLSSQLFSDIKSFLLEVKKTGRLLAPSNELYSEFVRQRDIKSTEIANLRDQFDTCIGRLENRDLIRQLSFGGYVLLQPELLDAYASAMVNTAKDEPDGLGSLAEEVALSGKFYVPQEQKIKDFSQEQLLLHATVEELVCHDLALRESADDGSYLVFPSQFNRDYEDAPEPKGKAIAITFDGPVQSLYSTLAVRLGHSGLFTTGRAEMWRNASVFTAKAGGKCGLFVQEFAEARGRLVLFFNEGCSLETRFHFEEFTLAHVKRRALRDTIELLRFFICTNCGDPVPDNYVKRLKEKGKTTFTCPCGGIVPLVEPRERIHFKSKIEAMEQSADRQRDFDAFVVSAKGEMSTKKFRGWAGGERVTLAIVFTDIVGSTVLGEKIGDEAMNEVRRSHFTQSRLLISQFKGREIKTIGDSFMTAFKCVDAALDYALALQKKTGHPKVQIRAGIHIGAMQVEEEDVFGATVNFAARIVGAINDADIWLSDRAKDDVDRLGAKRHKYLKWERKDHVPMKGFAGEFTLWVIKKPTG